MIEAFMDGAIIIDNNKKEVENLVQMLEEKNIWSKYYHPSEFESGDKKLPNKKIIFLDLHIKDGEGNNLKGHISYSIQHIFMKAIGDSYNPYGIVLWSGHTKQADDGKTQLEIFKEQISKAISSPKFNFQAPLFIVGLDKRDYYEAGSFEAIFTDLEHQLKANTAAKFFINWSNAINEGKNKSIQSIYSLVKDYNIQDENLRFLLYHLAKNQTGIHHDELEDYPLHSDAYYAFSNLLMYEISSSINMSTCGLFENMHDLKYSKIKDDKTLIKDYKNAYFINGSPREEPTKLDSSITNLTSKLKILQEYGNTIETEVNEQLSKLKEATQTPEYQSSQAVKDELDSQIKVLEEYIAQFKHHLNAQIKSETDIKDSLKLEMKELNELDKEINSHFATINTKLLLDENVEHCNIMPGNIYKIQKTGSEFLSKFINTGDIPILIEMTPPCDFANRKNGHPKLLGGFITKYSDGRMKQLKSDAIYTESQPLKLAAIPTNNMMICFDFRHIGVIPADELNDPTQYTLLYRAKESLFSDILQKLSSHTARLGLAVLH